jgi:transcriptional regulator of aromatic amino acid metabolism
MRIDVEFVDRVGIAHEILAQLAARQWNVVAMEVVPPHVYIDIPELQADTLATLRPALNQVAGVLAVRVVDVLPGTRRRLHLDALLAALADPVLALDASGCVVLANSAAQALLGTLGLSGTERLSWEGLRLDAIFDDAALQAELVASAFHLPGREVSVRGQPFLLDVTPVSETGQSGGDEVDPLAAAPGRGVAVGAVLTLYAPQRIGGRLAALQNLAGSFDAIIGESGPIRALKARALRVAPVDAPLMIIGETGTGKELVAQACHAASGRSNAPFLALNCAALPESLAESELFGYSSGAFSGAQRGGKPGLIEMAEGGSVFLDEVGEMSLYLQAKLLRFLNDGKFRRIGGEREIKVNVRIICATHRNLEQMVAERTFREDLYYRLNVLNLALPALRERPDDILLLARHFIERACRQAQKPLARLSPAAQQRLMQYEWPGNVRQLQNVIFRAITLSDRRLLDLADLDLARPGAGGRNLPASAASATGQASASLPDVPDQIGDWAEAVAGFERALLLRLYPQYIVDPQNKTSD